MSWPPAWLARRRKEQCSPRIFGYRILPLPTRITPPKLKCNTRMRLRPCRPALIAQVMTRLPLPTQRALAILAAHARLATHWLFWCQRLLWHPCPPGARVPRLGLTTSPVPTRYPAGNHRFPDCQAPTGPVLAALADARAPGPGLPATAPFFTGASDARMLQEITLEKILSLPAFCPSGGSHGSALDHSAVGR